MNLKATRRRAETIIIEVEVELAGATEVEGFVICLSELAPAHRLRQTADKARDRHMNMGLLGRRNNFVPQPAAPPPRINRGLMTPPR